MCACMVMVVCYNGVLAFVAIHLYDGVHTNLLYDYIECILVCASHDGMIHILRPDYDSICRYSGGTRMMLVNV